MWRQIGAHDVMQCKGRPNSKGDPRLVDWWGARALMKNSHKKKNALMKNMERMMMLVLNNQIAATI